jgi:hypothetical protein
MAEVGVQQSFSTGSARAFAGGVGLIVAVVIVAPGYLGRTTVSMILEVYFDICRISD